MKLRKWYGQRGADYVGKRAAAVLERYGIAPGRAARRAEDLVEALAELGCAPTLPTPARVVERHPQLIRRLQEAGAEIAVHGYDHVDLAAYSPAEASRQLVRAAEAFSGHGIEVHGFRCPYLSYTDGLLDALPQGVFEYSSNRAFGWGVVSGNGDHKSTRVSDVLDRLYKPTSPAHVVCVPSVRSGMVEIPVSLPDDLELYEALHLGPKGMAEAWGQILHRVHERGELFGLLFHPELGWSCQQPVAAVARQARRMRPRVWVARLREINSWWREKATFGVAVSGSSAGLDISFECSERATILARGPGPWHRERVWDGGYRRLEADSLRVPAEPRPFVGLPADAPERVVSFLRQQGYIVDTSDKARRCATYLDTATLATLTSQVELVGHIEASPGPLVRYWRWPNGARSALCVTGDLDALTLLDYASRLFAR